jgi:hypothetical protein
MTILIEDSPRNLPGWITEAASRSSCSGAVMTPFATPWVHHSGAGQKASLRPRAERMRNEGVPVWFDPTTHALQMSGVGDFRYYNEYELWGGPRGDLTTSAYREEHVRKVFAIQDLIGSQHLAPTILLHTGLSTSSEQALSVAREAISQDPRCWLSISGTSPFWASGAALDAHIGALAELEPAGWFLTAVRPLSVIPVKVDAEEIHGMCRTTRALSEYGRVHISHGDFAALPAVAAGALSIGSGWDKRQRVCSYTDYAARSDGSGGGGWYERATILSLLGSLSTNETAILDSRDRSLAELLGGIPAPGAKESYLHHVFTLSGVVFALCREHSERARYDALVTRYTAANTAWDTVASLTNCDYSAKEWVTPLAEGLQRYGATEGW